MTEKQITALDQWNNALKYTFRNEVYRSLRNLHAYYLGSKEKEVVTWNAFDLTEGEEVTIGVNDLSDLVCIEIYSEFEFQRLTSDERYLLEWRMELDNETLL